MKKTYEELITLDSFEERFKYLKLNGKVGDKTFGSYRYLNQRFYTSDEWKEIQRYVRIRDLGNDLGVKGRPICGYIYVHHINPITIEDLLNKSSDLLDPNNLISSAFYTHNCIHYGDESILLCDFVERTPNDTIPWR